MVDLVSIFHIKEKRKRFFFLKKKCYEISFPNGGTFEQMPKEKKSFALC